MSVSVFEHPWLGGLFGDDAVQALFASDAQLQHILAFEHALTNALEQTGRVTSTDAEAARSSIADYTADFDTLRDGTARDGVVIPTLIEKLRDGLPCPEAIHGGATSQDAIDTSLALTLVTLTKLLRERLSVLIAELDGLDAKYGSLMIAGRTRMQAALPIPFSHRIGSWRRPLARCRERLGCATDEAARLQLGGAVGDRSTFGDDAARIGSIMADELGLVDPGRAWHSERAEIVAYAECLSRISGAIGKIGQDIALMSQQGVDEVTLAGGGASSAMAHKNNPILAELLVTLARFNATQVSGMHHALVHEQERSGVAWSLEWMILPQMATVSGRALSAAAELVNQITSVGNPRS